MRHYEAILLDVDGTLVDDAGRVRPRVRTSLHAAAASGVVVMLCTGRSSEGTQPVLEELGLATLAVVYNGAGLYCGREERLLEVRTLAPQMVQRLVEHARAQGYQVVTSRPGEKFASPPRNEVMRRSFHGLECLQVADGWELPLEGMMRTAVSCELPRTSAELEAELRAVVDGPCYTTHYPLRHLADHRDSPVQVVDVQPACMGKAEGLRVLSERHGIAPERVVAVGDATNDLPMFEAAGLSVAMGQGMAEARAFAQRVIGDNESDSLAELVDELFGM